MALTTMERTMLYLTVAVVVVILFVALFGGLGYCYAVWASRCSPKYVAILVT